MTKRNLILFIVLAIATFTTAMAQQPVRNANGTITFTYVNPTADEVEIEGSFGKKDDMEKDDNGIWTYTTPEALASDMYTYRFIVDDDTNVTDPKNPATVRDIDDTLSYFIITGEPGSYYVDDSSIAHGTVEQKWYPSSFSKQMAQRRLSVYLPAEYAKNPTKKYPVLYLLHGTGGDEMAWLDMGRMAQIMDHLIAQGKAQPMIVVMPNGIADLDAAPGQSPYMNGKASHVNVTSWMGRTEAAFPNEVVPFIEKSYRTINDKQHRAIAGLSMGGMHAMAISANNPTLFNYIGLFSPQAITPLTDGNIGSIRRFTEKIGNVVGKLSSRLQEKFEAGAERVSNVDVYEKLDEKLQTQFAEPPALYYIAIGSKDSLKPFLTKFRKRLTKVGATYTYNETDGAHSWDNWRKYLIDFAPKLFK